MAGTKIITKYSDATATPANNVLAKGELAYSFNSGKLFIGHDVSGDIVAYEIGGKTLVDDLRDGIFTLGDELISLNETITDLSGLTSVAIDNITIDGNVISSTDANGNIVLDPNGTGSVDVSSAKITSVGAPTADTDAATKKYVDDELTAFTGGDLADFVITSPTNAQVLIYDDLNSQWENQSLSGDATIDDLGVVSLKDLTAAGGGTLVPTDPAGVSGPIAYGSGTKIPVLKIDANGRITDASTADVATTLGLAADDATSGSVNLLSQDLTFDGDAAQGVSTSASGVTISITVADATTSTKGVAEFSADNFAVASGVVTIKSGGIANDELANSTTFLGTTQLTLGDASGSNSDVTGLTSLAVDNITIDGNVISSTDTNGDINLTPDGTGVTNVNSNLTVAGDLVVQGTTTTVNSTVVEISDPIFVLGDNSTVDTFDRGVSFQWLDVATPREGFFGWDRSADVSFGNAEGSFVFRGPDGTSGDQSDGTISAGLGDAQFNALQLTDDILVSGGNVFLTDTDKVFTWNSGTSQFELTYNSGTVATLNADLDGNLIGGNANEIVYQSATSTTAFIPTTDTATAYATGTVLVQNASGVPVWSSVIDGGEF